jgi:hypothetical protein
MALGRPVFNADGGSATPAVSFSARSLPGPALDCPRGCAVADAAERPAAVSSDVATDPTLAARQRLRGDGA